MAGVELAEEQKILYKLLQYFTHSSQIAVFTSLLCAPNM